MAIKENSPGQYSLFEIGVWRTTIRIEPTHRLAVLCRSIPWEEFMEKAVPILYSEQGIEPDTGGRQLDLRAHLGAYILQSVHPQGKARKTGGVWQKVDRQCLPGRLCASHRTREPEASRSKISDRVAVPPRPGIQEATEELRNRSRNVFYRKSGILFGLRYQKDRHPAQRERAIPSQQERTERAIGPSSWDRTQNRPSQSARAGEKPHENRPWGFDLGLPVRPVLQLEPFDDGFGGKPHEFNAVLRKHVAVNQRRTGSPKIESS